MAGLSGASGRRCGILCVRRTRQPVSDPSPLTDTHTPWPRLLMPGAWLCRGQATGAYIECVCRWAKENRLQSEGGRFAPGRFRVVTLSPRLGGGHRAADLLFHPKTDTLVPFPVDHLMPGPEITASI